MVGVVYGEVANFIDDANWPELARLRANQVQITKRSEGAGCGGGRQLVKECEIQELHDGSRMF